MLTGGQRTDRQQENIIPSPSVVGGGIETERRNGYRSGSRAIAAI